MVDQGTTWGTGQYDHIVAGIWRQAVASQGTASWAGVPEVLKKVTSPSWHWVPYGPIIPTSLPA